MYLEILYVMSVFALFILTIMTCSLFHVLENRYENDQISHLTSFSTSRCIFERLWMKCLDWVSN